MNKAKIKVLHVIHNLNAGGMEGRVGRLCHGLDPERFEVAVMALRPPDVRQVELPAHVPYLRHFIPPGLHLGKALSLAAAIRKGGYDLVHTHNWSSMFYGVVAARLAGVGTVIHGEHGLDEIDRIPPRRLMAQRLLAGRCRLVIAVNASIENHVSRNWKVPRGRLLTLANGVDLSRYRPAPEGPEVFTVGTVGRQDPVKDFPTLVEAFRLLRARLAPAPSKLIMVGHGSETGKLKAQVAAAGMEADVLFPGDSIRPEEWYGRFSAYVNCSVYEGMSNTVLEAMASGLPLAVSDVGGHRDWLREGESALYFKAGDAAGMASALERLYREPGLRAEMGKRNRARTEAEYDNREFIGRYARIYENLLRGRPGSEGLGLPV